MFGQPVAQELASGSETKVLPTHYPGFIIMNLLSSHSNWETPQSLNTDLDFQQEQPPQLATQFLVDYSDNFDLLNPFLDPSYDTNFFYPESYSTITSTDHLLPNLSYLYDPPVLLSPNTFPPEVQDFDAYPHTKRQKLNEGHYYPDMTPTFCDGYASSTCSMPELQALAQFSTGRGSVENGKQKTERCVSAQGIAARERRRKITEKTQALGKLVPGGSNMNTAEMLQAAFKYVKYLQAQVGVLELMGSLQDCEEAVPTPELQILASATIQEKLYMEDQCLVPKALIRILADHQDTQPEPPGLAGPIKPEG
ncbi:hypothetical protein Tsubulata_013130 [Turnera subulata]|uniref:BHLH domain-containing protein n=1 Tax=Turnera subulata TaxID=218843 RepID=A0A9Q0FED1_9ROSI|nr:hypothetical protein Tsubulata_013130 [Turnera subulata]